MPDILEDAENGLTALCRELIAEQAERLRELDKAIKEQDKRLGRLSQADALSRRMLDVPGVGPITATIVASDIGDGKGYASSRDYAASLGLVPERWSKTVLAKRINSAGGCRRWSSGAALTRLRFP
ncbi:transposase [Methylotuvimicrobium sp. KM1]|uniref:transposase n=1 Tax=Methylotuvimicrobium sp. KM1 TaxID=3377707 RepID=UPI00384D234C